MNGKIVLDYSARAEPLTIADLKRDNDQLYAADLEVDRVVLWEHQLDYLIKGLPVAPCLHRGESIWGIPLTVKKNIMGFVIAVER